MDLKTITATRQDLELKIDELTEQVAELMEQNANLRLVDAAMRRNTALFEALLANAGVGIALTGPDRRIVRVVRGLTGFRKEEVVGTLIESVVLPEDQPGVLACYQLLLSRSRTQINRRFLVRRADGAVRCFSVTLTDMLDDPNVQGIVWNYEDVTAEKDVSHRVPCPF